jgi:hypothetical protein
MKHVRHIQYHIAPCRTVKAAVVKPQRADTRWLQKSQQYVIDENKLWPTVHPASRLLRHTSRAEQKTWMETSLPTYPLGPRGKMSEAETLLPLIQNCHNKKNKKK